MASKFNLGILITAKDQASAVVGKVGGSVQANAAKFRKVGAIATAAGGAILGSLALITKGVAKTGDELAKASAKTGVTVESLSRLKFAAEQSGVGFSELEMAMARQSRAASEASQGVATYSDVYDRLGVSVTGANGELKDGETLFRETAEALSKIPNATERSALAMDIFGRSGANMLPLLNQGAKGIEAYGKRAHELGIVIDGKTAKASERFNDTLAQVKLSLGGTAVQIATVVMPIVSNLAEKIATVVGKFTAWSKEHPRLTSVLVKLAIAVGGLMTVLGPVLVILPSLAAGWGLVSGALAVVVPALGAVVVAIGPVLLIAAALGGAAYLIIKHWDKIAAFFVGVWRKVKGVFTGVWGWMKDAGDKMWRSFLDGIKAGARRLWDAVKGILGKLRDLLPFSDAKEGPLRDLTAAGKNIPKTIATGIDEGGPAISDALRGQLAGLGDIAAEAGGRAGQDIPETIAAGIEEEGGVMSGALRGQLAELGEMAGEAGVTAGGQWKDGFEAGMGGGIGGEGMDGQEQQKPQTAREKSEARIQKLLEALIAQGVPVKLAMLQIAAAVAKLPTSIRPVSRVMLGAKGAPLPPRDPLTGATLSPGVVRQGQMQQVVRVKHELPAGVVLVAAEELIRLPRVQDEVHKVILGTAARVPGQYEF